MEELTHRPNREPLVQPGGIDCHVRDMTATVAADVTLAQFQLTLAEHNQWLPIDGDPDQPIGTLVSCDSTGPLRLGYGAWRDLLLGAQFTNGRGQLVSAGGRTVKNVAGYDLTKFMVGQRGIFGSLVTLTTRTYQRPAGAILARYAPDTALVGRLMAKPLRPHWAVLTSRELFFGYMGDPVALAFYRSTINQSEPLEVRERSLDEDIAHRRELWRVEQPLAFRASVPPANLIVAEGGSPGASALGYDNTQSRSDSAADDLHDLLPNFRWSADPAFGIIVGGIETETQIEAVQRSIQSLGGTVKFFHGEYGPISQLSTTPAERQIIERLKFAFDPDQKLSPLPWPRT
jgi:hypothetical protein